MRPKPLISTFTSMSKNPFCGRGPSVLLAEPCQDLGGDSIGGQAEMLVQIVDGRRCAETVDAETQAIAARIAFPAKCRARLDRHDQRVTGQDIGAVGGRSEARRVGKESGRVGLGGGRSIKK